MNMKMTKTELIAAVAEETGLSKKDAKAAVESVFEVIKSAVKDGNEVTISNFGKIFTRVKPASEARNPSTGETVSVPEHTVVKMKPSKNF